MPLLLVIPCWVESGIIELWRDDLSVIGMAANYNLLLSGSRGFLSLTINYAGVELVCAKGQALRLEPLDFFVSGSQVGIGRISLD